MGERQRWNRLIGLMERERDLLDDFSASTSRLRNAVHSRDWPALELSLTHMDDLSNRLEILEGRRLEAVAAVSQDTGDLGPELAKLPPGTRRRFQELRGELKARLVTVRARTRGLAGYAGSRARLGREIMEELVPSTRGRMYDKRGRSASGGRDPLVVSRHL